MQKNVVKFQIKKDPFCENKTTKNLKMFELLNDIMIYLLGSLYKKNWPTLLYPYKGAFHQIFKSKKFSFTKTLKNYW